MSEEIISNPETITQLVEQLVNLALHTKRGRSMLLKHIKDNHPLINTNEVGRVAFNFKAIDHTTTSLQFHINARPHVAQPPVDHRWKAHVPSPDLHTQYIPVENLMPVQITHGNKQPDTLHWVRDPDGTHEEEWEIDEL